MVPRFQRNYPAFHHHPSLSHFHLEEVIEISGRCKIYPRISGTCVQVIDQKACKPQDKFHFQHGTKGDHSGEKVCVQPHTTLHYWSIERETAKDSQVHFKVLEILRETCSQNGNPEAVILVPEGPNRPWTWPLKTTRHVGQQFNGDWRKVRYPPTMLWRGSRVSDGNCLPKMNLTLWLKWLFWLSFNSEIY